MTPPLFELFRKTYLSAESAELNRWNSKGTRNQITSEQGGELNLLCSGSEGMIPEELGNLRLIDLTLSNFENNFDELLIVSFERLAVEFEEDQPVSEARAYRVTQQALERTSCDEHSSSCSLYEVFLSDCRRQWQ